MVVGRFRTSSRKQSLPIGQQLCRWVRYLSSPDLPTFHIHCNVIHNACYSLAELRDRGPSGRRSTDFIHGGNCFATAHLLILGAPVVSPHSYQVAAIATHWQIMLLEDV
jgi:hypothetical protein